MKTIKGTMFTSKTRVEQVLSYEPLHLNWESISGPDPQVGSHCSILYPIISLAVVCYGAD